MNTLKNWCYRCELYWGESRCGNCGSVIAEETPTTEETKKQKYCDGQKGHGDWCPACKQVAAQIQELVEPPEIHSSERCQTWHVVAWGDRRPCSTIDEALREAREALEAGSYVVTVERREATGSED